MFKVGDYVVYKRNICKIVKIYTREKDDYYSLCPIDDSSLSIDLSIDKAKDFIMPIISKEDALNLIFQISSVKIIEGLPEKQYENEYKKLLLTGNHLDLVQIIKTTYSRNQNRLNEKKKIGEKDNNYFNIAEHKLYNELSIALNMSYDETKEYVTKKVSEQIK